MCETRLCIFPVDRMIECVMGIELSVVDLRSDVVFTVGGRVWDNL